MTNRLRSFLRTYFCCVSFLLLLTCFSRLSAQSSFFNFNYNGPDSLSVGLNCNLALQGNIPNPIVSSTIGATIITSMFDATTSGFPFSQLWIGGETAHIYWFVEDNMGHAHTFEFFVFFVDNTPPVFDLTGINDTLFFNSIVQVPAPPIIPIVDNCTGFTQTFSSTTPPDTCEAGQFTRTWTATDMVGNQATFTQTIIIAADVTPPTISFPPQNGSAACEVLATAYPAWLAAQMAAFTAMDPSGIQSLTNNGPASFPPGCTVPLTVTFKATDNCNLMIPTTAVFSTSDTEGPVVITPPKDTISYCSPGGNHLTKLNEWIRTRAYSQVYDSCSAPLTYSMKINNVIIDSAAVIAAFWASFNNACGTQTIGNQMVDQVSAFVSVHFFVTDACGNQTKAGQATFGAVDTLAPVVTGINTTEQCGAGNDQTSLQNWINAKGNAAIVDDCSAAFWTNYSFTTSNGQTGSGAFNAGPYPTVLANNCTWFADVTFHASDECGNLSAKTLRFQILDSEAPVFTGLSPNITVYCPNPLPTVPAATIVDNCDLSPSISFSRVFQDSTCAGNYTVVTTWQATDDCGNSTTITQNIFVRDTTKPVFTLVPAGVLMRCDTFILPAIPVQGQNIDANDLCSPIVSITTAETSTQLPNPSLCGHYSYTITRTFTATDQCANTQSATQIITVIDNQPPVPGGVLDTTALCSAMLPFPAPTPTAFDFCSGPTVPPSYVNSDTMPGSCAGRYTITLNWIASDYCGNQTPFEQLVHVIDTVAPTLSNLPPHITVECNAIPAPPNVSTFNGIDNCAAGVSVILEESEIRNPNLTSCDHWTNYTLRREWTVTDDCGNGRTYTQDIQIEDTTPPVLVAPPAFSLPNDIGDCGRQIPIPAPLSVTDVCTAEGKMVLLKDTLPILPIPTMDNGGQLVDTMFFHFATPNLPPNEPATSSVSISVFIEKADAEEVMGMEFFKVFGEGGDSLGRTSPAPGQCSNTPGVTIMSMTAAQFNLWASDGDLAITLVPVGINPVCSNSRVRIHIGYSYTTPNVPIAVTYSLDGGPSLNYPPVGTTFLEIGTHTVVYTATDCVNNSSTASVQIVVNDVEPPSISAPAPMTTYVGPGNCMDTVTLPFPVISENCKMSGHLKKSSTMQLLSFIMDPDAPDPVPADVNMNIPGLIPNAIANGTFRIKFRGDNADPREFFNIFPNLSPIPITSTSSGMASEECQVTRVDSISASPNNINTWAAGGSALFRAEANTNAGLLFDFDFINPCVALLPNQTDGISRLQVELEYDYAIINFTITNNLNAVQVASGAVQGTQTTVTPLPPGNYTVKYTTTDNAGLMSMTTFPLVIRDTIRPTAHCKDALIINVNPSGLVADNYVLQPSEINLGSIDNCSGSNLTYSLSQNTFNCSQAGSNYNVVLTVSDASGNTSTCSTVVAVQNAMPAPSYPAVCEGDTLQLFANPPFPSMYSYMWTGPSFAPTIENPVIFNAQPSNQGLYTVKITGFTGCTATGSITVVFANLTVPDISVSGGFMGTKFCQGQNIGLNTPTYQGSGVSYLWFTNDPVPVLIGTTTLNTFTVNQPAPGQYHFFVKVKVGECLTPNSIIVTVDVFARPPAIVVDDFINVCAGDPLALATNVSGPGLTYLWNGPMWGGSVAQNPLVTSMAALGNSGIYTLRTFQNGCESLHPDTAVVVVHYTPPTPQIFTNINICMGDRVVLKAQVSGSPAPDYFEWQDPSLNTFTTNNIDSLVLTNVNMSICGNWRVRAGFENCFSDWSSPLFICPQAYPIVTADSNSPICTDSTLNLSATSSIGGLSWCWTLPNNTQIFSQNPSVTPGIPGIHIVVGKTSQGCADTDTVLVVGSTSPIIDTITLTAPICEDGSSAIMIPTVNSIHGPNFLYIWTNGIWTQTFTTATFTIPTVGPSDNGPYTLIVKDTFGCPSNPKTVNLNVQAMVKMPTMLMSSNPICEGGTVTLSIKDPDYDNALYHWIDPNQVETITSGPQLVLTGVSITQAGNYTVYVSEGVCQSPLSNTITLVVNPIPATPIITSNQPVCPGFTLTLDANVTADQYMWTGPFGYTAVVRNPIRPDAMLPFEGVYTVAVTVKGCTSTPGTIQVDIMQPPKKPLIRVPAPQLICLEQLPITGFLHIEEQWQTPGAIYTWINTATGDTIPNPSPLGQDLYYANLPASILTPGWHSFKVIAWKQDNINGDGCSIISDSVSVRFDTIPDNFAQVVPDHPACAPGPIFLEATHPSGNITGRWTFLGGFGTIINNRDSSTANFSTFQTDSTYSFSWALSSGGCLNFSADTLNILVSAPEQAHAGRDTFICDATGFSLYAMQGQYSFGTWSQFNQNGVVIADSSEPSTPITGLNPGNPYNFVWTLDDIGCGAPDDTIHVFYYSVKPNITGPEFVCTGVDCANLSSLALQSFEHGTWTSKFNNLVFTPPNSPNTTVCGLVPGENEVYWTINDGQCGNNSTDVFIVNYEISPTANPDTVQVEFGNTANFQVLTNDILPDDNLQVDSVQLPINGTITKGAAPGAFIYRPNSGFSGTDVFIYKICNRDCGDNACSTASVTFIVGKAGECYIPTIITPNGDNLNDAFRLPPECYLFGEGAGIEIEVTIFNQWGDYVYHQKPFIQDVDVWDGKYNGADLPAGTYYYVVKFEGADQPKAGFIVLQR